MSQKKPTTSVCGKWNFPRFQYPPRGELDLTKRVVLAQTLHPHGPEGNRAYPAGTVPDGVTPECQELGVVSKALDPRSSRDRYGDL